MVYKIIGIIYMKNQIIKSKIDFLNEFIVSIGTKEHNYIMINENHYKQALYTDKIKPFFSKLEPYYHISKKFYLFREVSYAGFITILRQIAKVFGYNVKSLFFHCA